MASKTEPRKNRVITKEVRLSYAYLLRPRASDGDDGDRSKYGAKVLIPKDDRETMRKMREAQIEAIKLGEQGKFNGKKIKRNDNGIPVWGGAWDTIHDGDESDDEVDEGHWTVNVSSNRKPGVIDRKFNEILDESEIYSGCYARVSLTCQPFEYRGKVGVTFYLDNVQKLRDGEPLGGRAPNAEADFDDDLDDEYDDEDDDLIG